MLQLRLAHSQWQSLVEPFPAFPHAVTAIGWLDLPKTGKRQRVVAKLRAGKGKLISE